MDFDKLIISVGRLYTGPSKLADIPGLTACLLRNSSDHDGKRCISESIPDAQPTQFSQEFAQFEESVVWESVSAFASCTRDDIR
ncbi:hypothetical protein Ac2012v2_007619 [Leucoagaricus gongylophorus]